MSRTETTSTTKTPMSPVQITVGLPPSSDEIAGLLKQYGCGPIHFSGTDDGLYERHLLFDNVNDAASPPARAKSSRHSRVPVRDILSQALDPHGADLRPAECTKISAFTTSRWNS